MDTIDFQSSSQSADWLIFLFILLALMIPVACTLVWWLVLRNRNMKAKRKQIKRHKRQINPTLAQTGGLPPRRDPNQPPQGL